MKGKRVLFILIPVLFLAFAMIALATMVTASADGPNRASSRRGAGPTPTPTPTAMRAFSGVSLRGEEVNSLTPTPTPTPTPTAVPAAPAQNSSKTENISSVSGSAPEKIVLVTPTPISTSVIIITPATPVPGGETEEKTEAILGNSIAGVANVNIAFSSQIVGPGAGSAVYFVNGADLAVHVHVRAMPASSGVQVKIRHANNIELDNVQCTGLFAGAGVAINAEDQADGTLVGCYFLPVSTASGDGEIMSFRLKMTLELYLGEPGPEGTQFSLDGIPADPDDTLSSQTVTMKVQ